MRQVSLRQNISERENVLATIVEREVMKNIKKAISLAVAGVIGITAAFSLVGCGNTDDGNGGGGGTSDSILLKRNPYIKEAVENFDGTASIDPKSLVAQYMDEYADLSVDISNGFARIDVGESPEAEAYVYHDIFEGITYSAVGAQYAYSAEIPGGYIIDIIEDAIKNEDAITAKREGSDVVYGYSLDVAATVKPFIQLVADGENKSAYVFVNSLLSLSGVKNDDGTDVTVDEMFDTAANTIVDNADRTFKDITADLDILLEAAELPYNAMTLYAMIETQLGIPLFEIYTDYGDKSIATVVGAAGSAMTDLSFNMEKFIEGLDKTYTPAQIYTVVGAVKATVITTLKGLKAEKIIRAIPDVAGEILVAIMEDDAAIEKLNLNVKLILTEGVISGISVASEIELNNEENVLTILSENPDLKIVYDVLTHSNLASIVFVEGEEFEVPAFTISNKTVGVRYVYFDGTSDSVGVNLKISEFTGKRVSKVGFEGEVDELLPTLKFEGETVKAMSKVEGVYEVLCKINYSDGTTELFTLRIMGRGYTSFTEALANN